MPKSAAALKVVDEPQKPLAKRRPTTLDDFNNVGLYDRYAVEIKVRRRIFGGVPRNPDLLKAWIASTTKHDDEKTTQQEKEARETLLQPTEERSWNGFPGDNHGLFVWSRQAKAMFREAATMLRLTTEKRGSKQILQHGFEIKGPRAEERIYLLRDGKPIAEADGYEENPIHVDTAQGPRSAIKRVDYVREPTLAFAVWVLRTESAEKRHLGESDIVQMLRFSQENGLGADRSQGHGKFDVTAFSPIQPE